jgi:hypothetical protein
LLNSSLSMFSASLMESAFIMITRSSAKATVFVWSVYLRLSKELYCMFQKPGPQHDPCGQPLVCMCVCVCVYVCVYMHVCMYVCICMYVCL